MVFTSIGLAQKCTYWNVTGNDGFGNPTFATPVQINCRWEDKTEKIQNEDGEEVVSRARVFLEDDVAVNGYLALGTHVDSDPRTVALAHRVLAYHKIPSLDAAFFERRAYL